MYNVQRIKERLLPYKDVIIFFATLLVANYFWKYTMIGDEDGELVTWFGLDVTAPFEFMSCQIAKVVYWLVSLVRDTAEMYGEHAIRFDTGTGTNIIWGCSGLKQAFIWTMLLLTTRGGWVQKIWYIPVGWVLCYVFNILRIFIITLFIENHQDWFPFLHNVLFKYLFYFMLFCLWVLFVEKIRQPASKH